MIFPEQNIIFDDVFLIFSPWQALRDSKNCQKLPKIDIFWTPLKKGGSRRDFFRKWTSLYVWTERPKICYHVSLYVIRHFLTNFSWFFRNFSKNPDFWKFLTFLEKVTPGGPGVDFLGNVGVENREKWGKMVIYGTNYSFYLNFQDFDPILGSPRGWSGFCIFQNHQNFQKSGFCNIS